MRSGIAVSAAFHAALVSLVMLSTPKQFGTMAPSIEVDLVRAEDVPKEEPKPPQKAEPEKPNLWDFPPEKPLIQLPDFSSTKQPEQPQSGRAKNKQAAAASQPPPSGGEQAATKPEAVASTPPPSESTVAAETAGASQPQPPPGSAQNPPSVFDPASIPMLLDIPNAQDKGFDFEATVQANLSGDERAVFKSHLRKCWKVPDGLAQATRVVLRVYLRRDGALASEPVLIEASASRDGPVVLRAAKQALKDCQPFAFLPANKYGEWRVLDLSFTPREMAGG
jgi:hypothetical protein